MDTFLKHSLRALFLLAGLAGSAAAQTNAKVSTGAAQPEPVAEAPQTSLPEAADAAPAMAPVKGGVPEGNGKWVPRVDSKTCPNGSETYVDEVNGGVKCWVNTN